MQNILWALSWWASWQGQVAWGSHAPHVADRACSTIPWISQWPPALLPMGVTAKTSPAVPKAVAAFSPPPAGWSHERAGQEPWAGKCHQTCVSTHLHSQVAGANIFLSLEIIDSSHWWMWSSSWCLFGILEFHTMHFKRGLLGVFLPVTSL